VDAGRLSILSLPCRVCKLALTTPVGVDLVVCRPKPARRESETTVTRSLFNLGVRAPLACERICGRLCALLLTAFVLPPLCLNAQLKLPGVPSQAVPQPAPAAAQPTPPAPPLAIPLPQIADQAEALDARLDEISRGLATQAEETKPNPTISGQSSEIAERARQADNLLQSGPDILQLREELVYWKALSRLFADQRKLLTDRADQLQDQINTLTQEQALWQATQDSIHDTEGIEVVAARVKRELDAIRDLRLRAQTQLNQLLTQQNELSETGRRVSDTLAKLSDAEGHFRVSIFAQDDAPLWSAQSFTQSGPTVDVLFHRSASQEVLTAREFVRARGAGLLFLPVLYGLALAATLRFKRYIDTRTGPAVPARAHEVFAHPYAMALIFVLLVTMPYNQTLPLSVISVVYLLWVGLLARLTPILVNPEMRAPVYLLLGLTLLEVLRSVMPFGPGMRRITLTLLTVALLAAFAWLTRPARLHQMQLSKWPELVILIATRVGLLLLAIALVANILGFVSLSRVLGVGTLVSAFFATSQYFVVRIALFALSVALESPWLSYLTIGIREAIHLWGRRILILVSVLIWWTRSQIYVFILQDSIRSTATSVLGFNLGFGKMQFTVGDVLAVILVLIIGFALAKGFSSVVRSVLTAKFPFQRGIPYAASKVTYYILSVLVLLAAVTAAGVDLNKFTVITGAVGVGVGFGLQDIVKNFASGLILLFERPIRVDDVIELPGMVGTVRRIGARSSTIVTAQGAEVIVPNSSLTSTQVINWTLSSQQRRVEIAVGVAYGTDPELVLRLLVAEAAAHESVLTNPGPVAFFMGFGDSALNFELRFWSESQDAWFQLKSDVTVGVARALGEAGIEIPFPQRDLHLRSVDGSIVNGSLPRELAGAIAPKTVTPKTGENPPEPAKAHQPHPTSGMVTDSSLGPSDGSLT
jgi:potassium-dependent mechanosensitive channel